MLAHDLLDPFSSLIGVVERNSADIVVQNMCFNDSMQQLTTDKPELTIDCCRSTSGIVPRVTSVVR